MLPEIRPRFQKLILRIALLLGLTSAVVNAKEMILAEQRQPKSAIIFLKDDDLKNAGGGLKEIDSSIQDAAAELSAHFELISGAKIPVLATTRQELEKVILDAKAGGRRPILLGTPAVEALEPLSAEMRDALADLSGFVIRANADHLLIAGSTPSAVAFGVYALLEDLGVRWFFPGKLGTVIPQSVDIKVEAKDIIEKPSLAARQFQLKNSDEWIRRQRAGGVYFPPAHGISIGKDASLETHPELYALVKGERVNKQLCLSNPETLKRAIRETKNYFRENPDQPWMGMGPNDGGGFCECEGCRAMDGDDEDPFSGGLSVTDRYVDFFNQVLKGIEDEFPDKKLAFYIYHNYMRPPVRVKPDARIAGAIAPIALCRVHGMNNPVCPERGYLKTLIDEWKELLPDLYERGYWFNLADPAMLFVQAHRMSDEIPYYARKGVKGYRTECMGHWALQGPSLYVAGKLMWNAKVDAKAVVHDFCEKLFGPAAETMEAYFTFLDTRLRDLDQHTGGAFSVLQFYPAEVRRTAEEYIKKAVAQAADSPWKERVAVFAHGFYYFNAFAETQEAAFKQDWEKAFAAMREMDAQREILLAMGDHPMISEGSIKSQFERFFRPALEQAHHRVTGGNRMVAPLSNDWQFLLDPQQIGAMLHYEKENVTGGNWQQSSIATSWSDQGLRYYKGLAWYRQEVEIPKEFEGKRIFLWFGGVDEAARVWVKGELVGTSPSAAFTPFEVDASKAVHSGKNVVTVCVANLKVNEIGTGGITSPAFFYLPKDGDAAMLENIKPLRETFP